MKILMFVYLVSMYGWIIAIVFTYLLSYGYKLLFKMIFNLEALTTTDKVFIGTKNNEKNNLLILLKMENFNLKELITILIDRAIKKLKKLRQRPKFVLFDYFWAETTEEEAIKRIIVHDTINGQGDLMNFLNKKINEHIDSLKELPYKIHLLPDNNNNGYLILQLDHSFSDGLGILSLLCSIGDNYTTEWFPSIMKRSYSDQLNMLSVIISIISFPLNAFIVFFNNILITPPKTPYKLKRRSTGMSRVSLSKNFNYRELSVINKKLKISFNDLVISFFSASMKKYAIEKNLKNNKFDQLVYTIPIGIKKLPNSVDEVQLKNDVHGLVVHIPAIDDICKEAYKIHDQMLKTVKNASINKTTKWLGDLVNYFLPITVVQAIVNTHVVHNDAVISNVPGCTKIINYGQTRITDSIPLCSTGRTGCFITLNTFNNQLKICIAWDDAIEIDPNEFLIYLEKEIDNLMKLYN